jgi:hypothetical protein
MWLLLVVKRTSGAKQMTPGILAGDKNVASSSA